MPAKSTTAGGFDARLFNQSQGMDSGFKGEDAYDVYDKAFRGEKATSIYRPTKRSDALYTDEEVSVHPSPFSPSHFFFLSLLFFLAPFSFCLRMDAYGTVLFLVYFMHRNGYNQSN